MSGKLFTLLCIFCACHAYTIDDSNGVERTFDGIGGLSGGGVRKKMKKQKKKSKLKDGAR